MLWYIRIEGAGPPVEQGFYYDMHIGERTVTLDELPAIEVEAKAAVKVHLVTLRSLPMPNT